jgi:hypothetical protein
VIWGDGKPSKNWQPLAGKIGGYLASLVRILSQKQIFGGKKMEKLQMK